jgi:hypothetical protein
MGDEILFGKRVQGGRRLVDNDSEEQVKPTLTK